MDTNSSNIPHSVTQRIDLLAQRYHSLPETIMNEALSLWVRQEEHRLTLEALADCDAGRIYAHEDVIAYFESLDTDNPLPRPQYVRDKPS